MNARQANKILIMDYLEAKGIRPKKRTNNYSLYRAPYREDKAASLKVSHQENLWVDYGEENNGGTLIDLVLRINQSFNVSEAIKDIHQTTMLFFSFHQQKNQTRTTKSETPKASHETRNAKSALPVTVHTMPGVNIEPPKVSITFGYSKQQIANGSQQSADRKLLSENNKQQKAKSRLLSAKHEIAESCFLIDISDTDNRGTSKRCYLKDISGTDNSYYLKDVGNNPAITDYLNQRGISIATAKQFCREIYYTIHSKNYFGIANRNHMGWSIRNKYWKGCTAQGYSYYNNQQATLCLFEGIFDLLSYVELNLEKESIYDYLILNSLVNIKQAIPILEQHQSIYLYLDHDDAGRKASKSIQKQFPNAKDKSGLYKPCKDLNEYHLKKGEACLPVGNKNN